MKENNSKVDAVVEGHRGEAVRLQQMIELLTAPGREGAKLRKQYANELAEKAAVHLLKAQEKAFDTYGMVLDLPVVEVPVGEMEEWENEGGLLV